jgi:PAS domain S-box-containing protein
MNDEERKSKHIKNRYVPSVKFYKHVIDSLQDYAIFTLDTDMYINSWSTGAAKIFGYENGEIIGSYFDVIFTEEDKAIDIPDLEVQTLLKEGRATDNRWHVRKDGSKFYAFGLVFPLTEDDGDVVGFVKILRDITKRQSNEEAIVRYIGELEELNTHKENILSIVSHDLRSPLGGIIGTADYLRSNFDTLDEGEVRQFIDLIHRTATDELKMLDYLVEWARVKYASEVNEPSFSMLASQVDYVFQSLGEMAGLKDIQLKNQVDAKTTVFVDEKMLTSILQNLVSNAIKHSYRSGIVTVSADVQDDKTIIRVMDTGAGMPAEIKDKLFTPQMFPLSKSPEDEKGAGIGLLLVKGFLEKSGGDIWVESTVGEGSTFYFTLPSVQPPDKPRSPEDIKLGEVP